MNNSVVIVERSYPVSLSKVWNALTNKDEMKKWYFDLADFKAEIGFKFQFWGGTEDNKYLHLCEVTEVVNGAKLTYSWRYDGFAGNSFVTFELFAKDERTIVRLTHRELQTFPANPDFAVANFEEGWNHIFNISLQEYLVQHQ